ncbi:hypothetical protein [Tychonema sp. LEGE 07203]|nr:hypothetical protein [Tychonema sp. LEGE 07203]MBE9092707.1 hypothetical protein [Tychonema sp. LEGE 07203]
MTDFYPLISSPATSLLFLAVGFEQPIAPSGIASDNKQLPIELPHSI